MSPSCLSIFGLNFFFWAKTITVDQPDRDLEFIPDEESMIPGSFAISSPPPISQNTGQNC